MAPTPGATSCERPRDERGGGPPCSELVQIGCRSAPVSAARPGMGDGAGRRVRHERIDVSIDSDRGVFMISVAAELAHMHPQTLRIYEARGLIQPKRSPKNTRLYSQRDVERLRRIQQLTAEGLNLAGVERVLALERRLRELEGGADATG